MVANKFKRVIPKIPVFRRNAYEVPQTYTQVFQEQGITSPDQQILLFHITQFGGCRFKRIPKYLENEAFFDSWIRTKRNGGFITLKANRDFFKNFGHVKKEPLIRKKYKKFRLDDATLKETGLSRVEADALEVFQTRLNDFYSHFRVGLRTPESGITLEDSVDSAWFNAVPNLGCRPRAGCRLFHTGPGSSYQRISSNLRHLLTINDQETTEIDISAATLQFMYIAVKKQLGAEIMPEDELTTGDPYDYFVKVLRGLPVGESNGMDRDSLKEVLYTLIYSSLNTQRHNVNRRFKQLGFDHTYEAMEQAFPRFFEALESFKLKVKDGNDKPDPPHLPIFREESAYAREILRRGCLETGIPILPIHDSFITQRDHFPELERIMRSTSWELYGFELPYKIKF